MTPKKQVYERAGAKIKRGDLSDLVEPLDYIILGKLPDEGTNVGGLYQIGTTIHAIVQDLNDPNLTSGIVTGRFRLLMLGELARKVKMVGGRGNVAYQRTAAGKEVYEAWLQKQK